MNTHNPIMAALLAEENVSEEFRAHVAEAAKTAFALQEKLASDRLGKPVWYRFWTIIGPCCTANEAERALFPTEQAAKQSKAFIHALSFFEPVEVGADAPGTFDWDKPAPTTTKRRRSR